MQIFLIQTEIMWMDRLTSLFPSMFLFFPKDQQIGAALVVLEEI